MVILPYGNFGNFGTGRATEEFKVSTEAYGRADYKYGLRFYIWPSKWPKMAKNGQK